MFRFDEGLKVYLREPLRVFSLRMRLWRHWLSRSGFPYRKANWCARPGSNRHALRPQILSLLRLPISSLARGSEHSCTYAMAGKPALAHLLHPRGCGLRCAGARPGNQDLACAWRRLSRRGERPRSRLRAMRSRSA